MADYFVLQCACSLLKPKAQWRRSSSAFKVAAAVGAPKKELSNLQQLLSRTNGPAEICQSCEKPPEHVLTRSSKETRADAEDGRLLAVLGPPLGEDLGSCRLQELPWTLGHHLPSTKRKQGPPLNTTFSSCPSSGLAVGALW